MGQNLVEKLIASHLVSGEMTAGKEVSIRIDQTLTQDALGTMAYLQFEAMGVKKVKTKSSVSYVDHLTLQEGFENADDHKYRRPLPTNTASCSQSRATVSAISSILKE